ncbi:MAG: hypothetical protein KGY80_11225 [Candidatus Thorarchaeota archaeon]|nr:hypothetical protein [Candidatus Thorarchaeota archaeon]
MNQKGKTRYRIRRTRYVSIAAIMTALALIGMYALVGIPNVELGTAILFVTALLFGLEMGVGCMLITAILYGSFNPWGGLIPQIWLSQVFGWLVVVVVGSFIGHQRPNMEQSRYNKAEFFLLGALLTVYYDAMTNLGYSLATGIPYGTAFIVGLPFMIIHVTSNTLIFGFAIPVLESIIRRDFGNDIWEPVTKKDEEISSETVEVSV